ncbi:hypothetical protein IJG72_03470 [bacterium]|nr:hypothetical protein [bacterium]
MGFNLNPINNEPQIRTTKTQNEGTTGGLGYVQRRNDNQSGKNNQKQEQNNKTSNQKDIYSLEDAKNASYVDLPPLLKTIEFFKSLIKKLLNQ